MARVGYVPVGERISFALARVIEKVARCGAARWSQGMMRRMGVTGRTFVVGVPYLWLLLFFLIPFIIVLKISLSELRLGMPPYEPLFTWIQALRNSRYSPR